MTAEDAENTFGIPAAKPNDEVIRKLTLSTLKHLNGEGGAARLVELCEIAELPKTILEFLDPVYEAFPKP
jgi:putative ATP-dependent endonuclease of OLD family